MQTKLAQEIELKAILSGWGGAASELHFLASGANVQTPSIMCRARPEKAQRHCTLLPYEIYCKKVARAERAALAFCMHA
jgi:hypothetical protein